MESSVEHEHYQKGIMLALSGYQLIEASLKLYLKNYYKIAKYLIADRLHFDFDGTDYDNAPLGQLVKAFSKTCADQDLAKDLKSEVSHRNHIAHKATLELFKKEPLSSNELNDLSAEIKIRGEKITTLLSRLEEANLVLQRHFDD